MKPSSLTAAATTLVGNDRASPIYGVTVPEGYRHWEFIAPAHETPPLDELRVVVGNDDIVTPQALDAVETSVRIHR